MEKQSTWYFVDNGATIGSVGSEGGQIVADEEYAGTARITLESGGKIAPWAITCGIYGSMVHTRWLGDQREAEDAYSAMKNEIASIVEFIPDASEVRDDKRMEEVYRRIEAFVTEFP